METPDPKRQRSEETREDVTTRLPDHMVEHVLGFFPTTKESIRTSVLSKRWKSLWSSAPVLSFSNINGNPPPVDDFSNVNGNPPPVDDFTSSLDKTLSKCNSHAELQAFNLELDLSLIEESRCPIDQFLRLAYEYSKQKYMPQIDRWVRHAILRRVKQLSLVFYKRPYEVTSSSYLFNHSRLTKLNLSGCTFESNARFSWPSLKALFLDHGYMYDDLFAAILSGCPVLEYFTLKSYHFFRGVYRLSSVTLRDLDLDVTNALPVVVEVRAPNLRNMTIKRMHKWIKFNIIDVSSLLRIRLGFLGVSGCTSINLNSINELLRKLDCVEQFTFDLAEEIQVLSTTKANGIVLKNCKDLNVNMALSDTLLYELLNLLKTSPNLKRLKVKLHSRTPGQGEEEWKPQQSSLSYLISHLTMIEVFCDQSSELKSKPLLSLVKFMLGNTMVLEKLCVTTDKSCDDQSIEGRKEKDFSMVEVPHLILSHKKASPNTIVQFREVSD